MDQLSANERRMLELKRTLHRSMNGVVADSMKAKGANYRLNYGVDIFRLREIAKTLPKEKEFAEELWKLPIREMKILATMVYPPSEFAEETAEEWTRSFAQLEMVEQSCFNLYPFLPYASKLVCRWIADENEWVKITGFQLFLRMSMRNHIWTDEEFEYIAKSIKPYLQLPSSILLRVAVRSVTELGRYKERRAFLEDLYAEEAYQWVHEEWEGLWMW